MKLVKLFILLLIMAVAFGATSFGWAEAGSGQKIERVNVSQHDQSARISWHTRLLSKTRILYSNNNQKYDTVVESGYLKHEHSVNLRALDPNTKYFYSIEAVDKNGNIKQKLSGEFTTTGTKEKLVVYQPYFTLLFDNYWQNINGSQPTKIGDIDGLNFTQPGFTGNALKVVRPGSYLQYSCENVFHPGFGSVTAWVSFDRFDKSAVIWQTNDSKYALYYEVGNRYTNFDKRIVARAGGNVEGEYPEAEYVIDPKGSLLNKWGVNEWHFITMTWNGKLNGEVTLFVDGRRVDRATYEDGGGCSTFRIGNNYREDNMHFSVGKIDEFKIHQWAMHPYYVNQNYQAYSYNSNFEKRGQSEGRVAGAKIRKFKEGKLLKAPNGKIYIISRGKRIHISDMNALARYKFHPIISVTWDEVNQYVDGGEFYSWSQYPDGTLLKAYGQPTVYWVWDGEIRPILNEQAFKRYGNSWSDVIEISQGEINTYPLGFTYR